MKTTIVMAALALAVSAPAYAQDKEAARPGRQDRERQFQGPGGPQFRGEDMKPGEGGGYGPQRQGRRGQGGWNTDRPGRGERGCPNCGTPQRGRQGQGFGRAGRGGDQELGPRPQRGGRGQGQGFGPGGQGGRRSMGQGQQRGGPGEGPGPRFDNMGRPSGPPASQWGRRGGNGPGPQGQPGDGPRRRGFGGPGWNSSDDRPIGPRDPSGRGSNGSRQKEWLRR